MQVQIKRQLKIELDQADITLAVKNFLAEAGHNISDGDLAKINFVKSPQTGLRAELSINDEVVADEPVAPVISDIKAEVISTASVKPEPIENIVTTPAAEPEAPGQVEPSTVEDVSVDVEPKEDVMPSVSQIAAMVEDKPANDPSNLKALF